MKAAISWNNNASQDGRLTMEVSPDQPLPKLVVLARGIQAQLYSSTTGKPVRGLMPREQALRIARIFA